MQDPWLSLDRPAVPRNEDVAPLLLGTGYNGYTDSTSICCPLDSDEVKKHQKRVTDTSSQSSITFVDSSSSYLAALGASASLKVAAASIFNAEATASFHAVSEESAKKINCVVHNSRLTTAIYIPQDKMSSCVTQEFKNKKKKIKDYVEKQDLKSAKKELEELKATYGSHIVQRTSLGSDLKLTFTTKFWDTRSSEDVKSQLAGDEQDFETFTTGFETALQGKSSQDKAQIEMRISSLSRGFLHPPASSYVRISCLVVQYACCLLVRSSLY